MPLYKNRLNMEVCLSNQDKIFGYVSNNSNFLPLNFIFYSLQQVYILLCKEYLQAQILYAATNVKELFFFEEEGLTKLYFKSEWFNHVCSNWKYWFVKY